MVEVFALWFTLVQFTFFYFLVIDFSFCQPPLIVKQNMNEAVMTFLIFYADLSNFSCQSDFAK